MLSRIVRQTLKKQRDNPYTHCFHHRETQLTGDDAGGGSLRVRAHIRRTADSSCTAVFPTIALLGAAWTTTLGAVSSAADVAALLPVARPYQKQPE